MMTRKLAVQSLATTTALAAMMLSGCATKNYVRGQAAPLIQKTNELDDRTAANNRDIKDVDSRATQGVNKAQQTADAATQNAQAAGVSATHAQTTAQDAVNRADSLAGVVANLDQYKQIATVSVNFGFDKYELTRDDKAQLDQFAAQLQSAKSYILEVTGGTDSTGDAQYNYELSQRRADAVVQYLASKYNVAPHKFYLIGIGEDQAVASNKTATGRAKNRRVEVQLLSNMGQQQSSGTVSQVQ